METKKQQAIRLAWIEILGEEKYNEIKSEIENNGWLIKYSYNPFVDEVYIDRKELLDIEDVFHFKTYHAGNEISVRPKSLSGIEDNNGWISIESEEDLPKEKISYEVWRNGSESRATYAGSYRWFVPHNDFPKTTKVAGITHYVEPIKRQPPIF